MAVASRRIAAALPAGRLALLGLMVGAVAGAIWLASSGKVRPSIDRARPVVRELVETFGPPMMETLNRYEQGNVAMARVAVPPAVGRTLPERIARVAGRPWRAWSAHMVRVACSSATASQRCSLDGGS